MQLIGSCAVQAERRQRKNLELLRSQPGSTMNASSGDPSFPPYAQISLAAARAASLPNMRRYRSGTGSANVLSAGQAFFQQFIPDGDASRVQRDNIIPGLGVTNLFYLALEAMKARFIAEHPHRHPVMVMTSPSYGLFGSHAAKIGVEVATVPLSSSPSWRLDGARINQVVSSINATDSHRVLGYYNINPHNPTGRVFDRIELDEVVQAAKRHDFWLIDDLSYFGLEHGGRACTPLLQCGSGLERTVTLFGVAKSFCAASFRSAIGCVPTKIVDQMRQGIEMFSVSVPELSQSALLPVLALDASSKAERRDYLDRNSREYGARAAATTALLQGSASARLEDFPSNFREEAEGQLNRARIERLIQHGIPGIRVLNPDMQAGYFLLLSFNELRAWFPNDIRVRNSEELIRALVEEKKVLFLGPESMLMDPNELVLRFSLGSPPKCIFRTIRKLDEFVQSFR